MMIPATMPVFRPPLLRGSVKGGEGVSSLPGFVVGCGLTALESPVTGGGGGGVGTIPLLGQPVIANKMNNNIVIMLINSSTADSTTYCMTQK
jgi:hypothetical protein